MGNPGRLRKRAPGDEVGAVRLALLCHSGPMTRSLTEPHKIAWLPERPADPQWSEAEARAVARAFDPRALPASFYDNPYPTYRALRPMSRFTVSRRLLGSQPL
jgi:hypothetical protein